MLLNYHCNASINYIILFLLETNENAVSQNSFVSLTLSSQLSATSVPTATGEKEIGGKKAKFT